MASIDYQDTDSGIARDAAFPAPLVDEYRVHFTRAAHQQMLQHAYTTQDVELCGVLLGDVCRDEHGPFLSIVGIIEGERANNYGAQVTFTHETWDLINQVKEAKFADQRIVGWYHTHPGFGIFLSSMDTFIQENFFNQPYQVAVVIETKSQEEGCFAWVDGKCTPLHRYWVGEETFDLRGGEVEPFSLQQRPASEDQTWRSGAKRADLGELPSLSTIVIGFLLLLLGLAFGRHLGMASLYDATYRSLQNEIYGLTEFAAVQTMAAQDMADLRQKLAAARAALDKKPGGGAVSEALGEAMTRLEELEAEYQRRRAAVREDIVRFSKGRRTLVQRLDGLRRDQKQTQAFVATLYLARLARDLNRLEADDYAALAPETKRSLRDAIERLLQFSPQSKSDIQTLFPGLLNAVYATSDSSPTGVKPSTEAKTK